MTPPAARQTGPQADMDCSSPTAHHQRAQAHSQQRQRSRLGDGDQFDAEVVEVPAFIRITGRITRAEGDIVQS